MSRLSASNPAQARVAPPGSEEVDLGEQLR
jgi:hypothetical protein